MKKTITIILTIALVLIIALSAYCYVKVANGSCPFCGAEMENAEKILRDGKTTFRYTCSEHFWHFLEIPFRIN